MQHGGALGAMAVVIATLAIDGAMRIALWEGGCALAKPRLQGWRGNIRGNASYHRNAFAARGSAVLIVQLAAHRAGERCVHIDPRNVDRVLWRCGMSESFSLRLQEESCLLSAKFGPPSNSCTPCLCGCKS